MKNRRALTVQTACNQTRSNIDRIKRRLPPSVRDPLYSRRVRKLPMLMIDIHAEHDVQGVHQCLGAEQTLPEI